MVWEVIQAAIRNGADPLKALWIVSYESRWNPAARNITPKEDSVGLFQLNLKGGKGATAVAQGIPVLDQNGRPVTDWEAIKVQIDWVTKVMAQEGYWPWTVYTGEAGSPVQWPGDTRRREAAERLVREFPFLQGITSMFVDWVVIPPKPEQVFPIPPVRPPGQTQGQTQVQPSGQAQPAPKDCKLKDVLYGLVCSMPPPLAWLPGCGRARACVGIQACRLFFVIAGTAIGFMLITAGLFDRSVIVTALTTPAPPAPAPNTGGAP
jgi:hypothetical protein